MPASPSRSPTLEFVRTHAKLSYSLAAFLVPFLIYVLTLRFYDYTYGFNVLATQYAMWINHSFSVGTAAHSVAPNNIPNVDTINYQGNYYVAYAPGLILLSYPFSVLGFLLDGGKLLPQGNAIVLLEAFVAFCGALGALLTYKICLMYTSRAAALLASLVLAFGTSAWPFASVVFPHDVTMLFVLGAAYCIVYYLRGSPNTLVLALAGLCLGLAATTDYVSTLLIFPVAAFLLVVALGRWGEIEYRVQSVKPASTFKNVTRIVPEYSGSFLSTRSSSPGSEQVLDQNAGQKNQVFNRLNLLEWLIFVVVFVVSGPLIVLGYNYVLFKNPFTFPEEFFEYVPQGQRNFAGLENRFRLDALGVQAFFNLFSLYRGLLVLSPVLIFGFFGLYLMLSKKQWGLRRDGIFFGLLFLTIFLPYSAWNDWAGGAAYGPRFLVSSLPYLVIPMSIVFANWRMGAIGHWARRLGEALIFFVLLTISVLTQGIGAMTTATPHLIYPPPPLVYQPSVEAIPDFFTGKYGIWWMQRLNMIGNVQDTMSFTVIVFVFVLGLAAFLIFLNGISRRPHNSVDDVNPAEKTL